MALKFISEDQPRWLKTILYGIDGSGKSTGAKLYCKSRGLNPVVIDFDYTNHTGLPRLQCDWDTDREVITGVIEIIHDVEKDPHYDTLIIDGVGTFNNLLLPKGGKESQRTYLIRTQNFKKIWKELLHANIHVIFIGQKDMIVTEENESSKFAEMINNMVDYKFHCIKTGKGFTGKDFNYICTKSRNGVEPLIGKPLLASSSPSSVSKEEVANEDINSATFNEIPKLIKDCVNALSARGMSISNDVIRSCIEDRCSDEKEYDACIEWLNHNDVGGVK